MARCLHEIFASHVTGHPDAIALEDSESGARLTYRELDERANALAHRLREHGVRSETLVPVCLPRGIDVPLTLLSVMKAGAAYVPIDPAWPAARIAQLLAHTKSPVVVARSDQLARLPHGTRVVEPSSERRPEAPASSMSPDHLAYVLFTSGSTGAPKGVAVTHRSVVNLVEDFDRIRPIAVGDACSVWTSFAFDVSVWETFAPLLSGGKLLVVPDSVRGEPSAVLAWLLARDVRSAYLPPSFLAECLRWIDERRPTLSLRRLLVGVEPIPQRVLARLLEAMPELAVINGYGPTETTICCTRHRAEKIHDDRRTPIGTPVRDVRVHVLDARMNAVPPGSPGELFVGGAGLARGYLDPEQTAERFVPDPFGPPGSRLYRTGDLVRELDGGALEFVGRVDHQVKIRGFRVEPNEVASALASVPGVRDAVVLARDEAGDKALVAYVVGDEGATEPARLRAALAEKLPAHMVPAAFVRLGVFPLNTSGKVDRAALPAPRDEHYARAEFRAAEGEIETRLAAIFADVLQLERVGADDDFFALGGHSLRAVQLAARVRADFDREIGAADVFASPTIRGLARVISAAPGAARIARAEPRPARPPLSAAQRHVWFLAQTGASTAYNLVVELELRGALHAEALRGALATLVERHEVLRTSYPAEDGTPFQRVAPAPRDVPLRVTDLRALAAPARDDEAKAIARAEGLAPFDLANGPPCRFHLVHRTDTHHTLVVAVHHIAFDGWSVAVLARELSRAYESLRSGTAVALPPVPLSYVDFAMWEQGHLASAERWRARLEGSQPFELPLDAPRTNAATRAGARTPLAFDRETSDRVRTLARELGTTPYVVLLASFASLLARHGASDGVLGTIDGGRAHAELEPLVGFFVRTIPSRIAIDSRESFAALVRRLHAQTLAERKDAPPLGTILEALRVPRTAGRNPLFDVMFVLQNTPAQDASDVWRVKNDDPDLGVARFDLLLELRDDGERFSGRFEFDVGLYHADTVARLADRFSTMLAHATQRPDQRVSEIPVLPDGERARLLSWSGREQPGVCNDLVHERFREQARKTPTKIAVTTESGEECSYGVLAARVERLARVLRARGVHSEKVVALVLPRTPAMFVALFASLEAGGAYLPIDPRLPIERIRWLLRDAAVALVLTTSDRAPEMEGLGCPVVCLSTVGETQDDDAPALAPAKVTPSRLAYVLYTSGSTGTPKGVMVSHGGLATYVQQAIAAYGEHHSAPVHSSFGFDLTVTSSLLPLLTGGTAVLVGDGDVEALSKTLVSRPDLTLVKITPAHLAMLEAQLDATTISQPRTYVIGGEALACEALEPWRQRSPRSRFINEYGPTETVVGCSIFEVTAATPGAGPVSIGRALPGTELYVLDARMELVPIGACGELYIGGAQVGRGYRGRPALTAERFVPNPFAGSGARLYRTGDMVRWLADGNLDFVGRIDNQIKLRGYRIELGEIEAALLKHPAVRAGAVTTVGDRDKRLVAYVVSETAVTDDEVRAHLGSTLPEYMVPTAFVRLDALPLTENGKVDRKALPTPDFSQAQATYVAPRTKTEQTLAAIWSEVLGLDRVGGSDEFFALGGHSLLATKLVSRVRRDLGVEIAVRAVFEHSTLSALARHVESLAPSRKQEIEPMQRVPRDRPLPLSFAETRFWFVEQLAPGSPTYNLAQALRLRGALDAQALARAFDRLVERHEAFRTRFVAGDDGEPHRVIDPARHVEIERADLSDLDAEGRAAETRVVLDEIQRRPFDLARGPLVRAMLVRLSDDEHVFVWVVHHIVTDAWSLDGAANELSALYGAFASGDAPAPAPLALQYADYAAWQRQTITEEKLAPSLEHWRRALAGAPTLELPTDRPRPPQQTFRGATLRRDLGPEAASALRAIASSTTTPFMTLLAAFALLLERYSGQTDLVIGTPVSDRKRVELEAVVGAFLNTLPLRVDVSGEPTVSALLERVRTGVLAAFEHDDVPFERLVQELVKERDPSRPPLVQAMFTLHARENRSTRSAGVEWTPFDLPFNTAQLDLWLTVEEREGSFVAVLNYNADLFDRATMTLFVERYVRMVRGLTADPSARASSIDVLSADERASLAKGGCEAMLELPAVTIHEAFAARAQKTPDRIAVRSAGRSLTYAELDRLTDSLATKLRSLGARADVPVAICLERSVALSVAMLGVLKSGAPYLPIDPSLPAERRAFMLEDSRVRCVVADESTAGEFAAPLDRVVLDAEFRSLDAAKKPDSVAGPASLAYVIYTSGSTGKPKGVMIEHRQVGAFFAAMDRELGTEPGTWLAVTSASFDISVLELLWTLTRGFTVVIQPEIGAKPRAHKSSGARSVELGLFYFANDEDSLGADKYRLLLDGARFADAHGFCAVWTPERHFHPFGGIYPNPSVAAAAVAAITERVSIRAGSVVLPLHDPIRVAEEWSVVDNISRGRVSLSFASGWQPDDFVLAPDDYQNRKAVLERGIDVVRRLWRGEAIERTGVGGAKITVRTRPRPVQPELPFWLTSAGNVETFRTAGRLGARVLTHLLGQDLGALAEKIAAYREAWRAAGHAGEGRVALMLHTFVHPDERFVRERARGPFAEYLRSSLDLMRGLAKDAGISLEESTKEDIDAIVEAGVDRFFETSGVFGSPERCADFLRGVAKTGVDEIACLIDFGIEPNAVLEGLEHLGTLKDLLGPTEAETPEETLVEAIRAHGVTHLQCTPTLLRVVLEQDGAAEALRGLRTLLVGGEAFPETLADALATMNVPRVLNMYGPTETTIWSLVHDVKPADRPVPLGKPIANTRAYVFDRHGQLAVPGAVGELVIGGDGVTRGYWARPDLSADRFVPDPFAEGRRLYRTGDLARRRKDGRLEFRGRVDHQIKIRGFRVELGEIESVLRQFEGVREAVVVARREREDLVAYLATHPDRSVDVTALRTYAASKLPPYMVPATFVTLATLPTTPNGKLDRRALPAPDSVEARAPQPAPQPPPPPVPAPSGEDAISVSCRIFGETLGVPPVDPDADFFALGGNSLLVLRLVNAIRKRFSAQLTIHAFLAKPTPRAVAALVSSPRSKETPPAATTGPSGGLAGDRMLVPLSWQQQLIQQAIVHNPGEFRCEMHAWRIGGPIDLDALVQALRHLAWMHPVLTATMAHSAGATMLRVGARTEAPTDVVDLGAHAEAESELARLLAARCAPIDTTVDGASLAGFAVYRLAPERHVLFAKVHTLITDGYSLGLLERDLFRAYQAVKARQPLPEKPAVDSSDVTEWERRLVGTAAYARALAHWKRKLDGAEPLPMFRSARVPYGSEPPFSRILQLDADRRARLEARARTLAVTPVQLVFVVYTMALSRFTKAQDVCITALADRRSWYSALAGTFGNLLQSVILRQRTAPGDTLQALASRARASYAEMAELGDRASIGAVLGSDVPARHPLAQAGFLVGAQETDVPIGDGLVREAIALKVPGGPRQGLSLAFFHERGALRIVGSSEFFDRGAFDAFARDLETALDAAIDGRTA